MNINELVKKTIDFDFGTESQPTVLTVDSLTLNVERFLVKYYSEYFQNIKAAEEFLNAYADTEDAYVEMDEYGNPVQPRNKEVETKIIFDNVMRNFSPFFKEEKTQDQNEVPEYEEPGVEVSGDTTNNMAVINMGTGIVFDTEAVNQSIGQEFDPSNPARHMIQQAAQMSQQQHPIQSNQPNTIQPNPMFFQQPVHKVDEPPKPPKPKPVEDKVDVSIPEMNIDSLTNPPIVKQAPEIIQSIPQAEPVSNNVSNLFDNSIMIEKFPKIPLLRIQEIANRNSCTVKYDESPHIGLISVMTFDHIQNRYVPEKSFVIDTGMIIDKRVKFFAHNPSFNSEFMLEYAPIYELLIADSNGRKSLDEKMINDVFIAGHANISKKEMYTESYKKLNTKVALISLPTKGLNKEERVSLQNYVIKMDQDGYFDSAIKMSPGSRFVFLTKQLDRNNLSDFTLVNEGVPAFYGTTPFKVTPIIIESKAGQVNIRSTGNPSDPPAQAVYPAQ